MENRFKKCNPGVPREPTGEQGPGVVVTPKLWWQTVRVVCRGHECVS